jgi:hypothetical protein
MQTGHAAQIDSGFGVAGATKYTFVLGIERIDVTGTSQVFGFGIGIGQGLDGFGAVVSRYTGATAGNLSVQLDKLSESGYISVEKTFEGKKPRTICRITPVGLNAFESYVEAIKTYLGR